MSVTDLETGVMARSLRFRCDRDPLHYFLPASRGQEAALRIDGKGLLVIGGNRSGKSQIGAVRTVMRLTGREVRGHRFRRRARRVWCVSQELPGGEDRPHTQVEAIRRWTPVDALRGGSWTTAYSVGNRVLTLADGGKIEFKSYDQDLLAFESAAVDAIWFDEEPTRREIFSSCLLRLVDRRGSWDMTLTPVLSLQGKSGIAEEMWNDREQAERDGRYRCIQLFTSDNHHLPREEVTALQRLPEEERQVRLFGAFARLGGRVLSEWDPARHLVDDYVPAPSLRHYLIIDPGWNVSAHLFAAADRSGRLVLYAEHYAREEPILLRMGMLHSMWQAFGKPELDVIMDSAAFPRVRQGGTERVLPSDADEYRAAARELGADWFYPRPCQKADLYAYRVKRYLQSGMITVCRGLRWWQWEQERWTRQREHGGARAQEQPEPDRPIDRYNHLMDCTRYLCNELPDPLPVPEPPKSRVEEFWEWMNGRLREPGDPMGE